MSGKNRAIGDHTLRPESLMMSYGYQPELSEGAIKSPIFQTSTFVFESAEQGKAFFELADGLRTAGPDEKLGLIYSRLNNPDLEILEDRLTLWDGAEAAAVFQSGMAAIAYCPATMTHSDIRPEEQLAEGITPGMVRISVGIEHPEDQLADIRQALEAV